MIQGIVATCLYFFFVLLICASIHARSPLGEIIQLKAMTKYGVSCAAQAGGLLSGKHKFEEPPEGGRFSTQTMWGGFYRYINRVESYQGLIEHTAAGGSKSLEAVFVTRNLPLWKNKTSPGQRCQPCFHTSRAQDVFFCSNLCSWQRSHSELSAHVYHTSFGHIHTSRICFGLSFV